MRLFWKLLLAVVLSLWTVAQALLSEVVRHNGCATRTSLSAMGNDYLSTLSPQLPPTSLLSSPQEDSMDLPSLSNSASSIPPLSTSYQQDRSVSLEGVPYSLVSSGIDLLYPPEEEALRNALSRTDGYWPFLHKGEEPPMELTYGEFELEFFARLLDRAHAHYTADPRNDQQPTWKGKTFVDIGSGTGRLIFAAAALHPSWHLSQGIELLPKINQVAQDRLDTLLHTTQQQQSSSSSSSSQNSDSCSSTPTLPLPDKHPALAMSPVQCTCGSFDDPVIATPALANADVVFFFSTCIPEHVLDNFANSVGQRCRPGTIVITTEYPLSLEGRVTRDHTVDTNNQTNGSDFYRFSLLEAIDGGCALIGGVSTAFVHRVEESLWTESLAKESS